MSAETIPGIHWVPVDDISELHPWERVIVVDKNGLTYAGFVTEQGPYQFDVSRDWAADVAPGSSGVGAMTHSPGLGDRFYREFGW